MLSFAGSPALLAQADVPDAPSPTNQQQTPAGGTSTTPQPRTQQDQAAEDLKKEEKQRKAEEVAESCCARVREKAREAARKALARDETASNGQVSTKRGQRRKREDRFGSRSQ